MVWRFGPGGTLHSQHQTKSCLGLADLCSSLCLMKTYLARTRTHLSLSAGGLHISPCIASHIKWSHKRPHRRGVQMEMGSVFPLAKHWLLEPTEQWPLATEREPWPQPLPTVFKGTRGEPAASMIPRHNARSPDLPAWCPARQQRHCRLCQRG